MSVKVQFASLRSNLINLSHSVASSIFSINVPAQQVIVELDLTTGSKIYLGWTGLYSSSDDSIEMDPSVASSLGIGLGDSVKIKIITSAPTAHVLHLEPLTIEDWFTVEGNAAFLESFMINQLRCVTLNQVVSVFPSPTLNASLKVTKIEPQMDGVAFLSSTSEVIVAPKLPKETQRSEPRENLNTVGSLPAILERCSVHPYVPHCETRELEIRGNLPFRPDSLVLVSLASPEMLTTNSTEEQEVQWAKTIMATYVQNKESKITGLSYGLSCALGLVGDAGIGVKVVVRQNKKKLEAVPRMILRPFVFSTQTKSVTSKPVHLSKDELALLDLKYICKGLVIPPVNRNFLPNGGIIDSESPETAWGTIKEVIKGSETPLSESKTMNRPLKVIKRPVVGQSKVIQSLISSLISGSGVLLYGSRGCGKTVVINDAAMELKNNSIRVINFKCSLYTDKALSTVREALKKVSYEAIWCSPSVVVFDDIDKMIPNEQEHSGDSKRQKQLAEVFYSIWKPLVAHNKVSILATAQDQTTIHSYLLSSHLLEAVVKLKSPDKSLREDILKEAINQSGLKLTPELDMLEVVDETEGYQPGDIWVLVDRVATTLSLKDSEALSTKDFTEASAEYVPASLRGVKLEKPSTKWSEVGGMKEVRQIVLETLDWPTKYAPVFENCPLRLRSGLLFYGYPGCGKTMLAGAIASQTGLNFISVKGPEILNKYIGASEQSVRDLFDRAQAAKPCILFFDEFDSIAPKRGHDSTGVTDRVVNQLLTQMDGAEGLDGVYVLAATSRPDMIDSALLRPGRLDKTLLCDMPNKEDRYDIVLRATAKMDLDQSINLHEVAEKTNGFTGADLQALVYNAYLGAVHKSLEKSEKSNSSVKDSKIESDFNAFQVGKGDLESALRYVSVSVKKPQSNKVSSNGDPKDSPSSVFITKEDMDESLKVSKPSISPKEVAKFKEIYSEFNSDRNGEMPPGTSSNEIGGRVTLQ